MKQLIHLISTLRSIGRSPWALAVCLATLGLGLSATADAPRRTFITSTPQAPPQVQYMVIELGGRRANDISESGQIVGNKDFAPELYHAAFWASNQGAPIDLGTLPGLRSTAVGMNPRREIVGFALNEDASVELPLFWASPNSAPVELPGLPAGLFSEVYSINPSGQIVGMFYSEDFSVERAVFWASSSSQAVILSTVGEFTNAVAAGISDNGQIVGIGYNEDFSKQRPFLWLSATSQGIDLTTFFPAGSNWDLDSMFAVTVNDRGEIVGSGLFTDGTVHNFVLIPVHGH